MKRELRLFFTALVFFTRIPSPIPLDPESEPLERAHKYFPLIGWLVGGLGALLLYLFQFLFPLTVSLLLALAGTIFVTGGFHEDGLSDSFDALGGGWKREEVLRIMKDSRVGTFGILALISAMLLKFFALYELASRALLPTLAVWATAQVLSRFLATTFVQSHSYVQDPDRSKIKPLAKEGMKKGELLLSAFWVLIPLALFYGHPWILLAILPAFLTKLIMARVFQKRIGGYTGDALGAVQQMSELVFILSALGFWMGFYQG